MKNILLFLFVLCGLAGCDKLDEKYKSQEVVTLTIASVRPVANEWTTGGAAGGQIQPLYIYMQDGGYWGVWHADDRIHGFDEVYEEGYEYVIDVYRRWLKDSYIMADASACEYFLKEVVSKEKKDSEGIPEKYLKEQ